MARQEFIDGWFRGKVGKLVGQSWHSVHYFRTWVRTPNPNTPKQQAARAAFTNSVHFAQAAMQVRWHDGLFDTTDASEFDMRCQFARHRLDAGRPIGDAIPLYPDSATFAAVDTVTEVDGAFGNHLLVSTTQNIPEASLAAMRFVIAAAIPGYRTLKVFVPEVEYADPGDYSLIFPDYVNLGLPLGLMAASRSDLISPTTNYVVSATTGLYGPSINNIQIADYTVSAASGKQDITISFAWPSGASARLDLFLYEIRYRSASGKDNVEIDHMSFTYTAGNQSISFRVSEQVSSGTLSFAGYVNIEEDPSDASGIFLYKEFEIS